MVARTLTQGQHAALKLPTVEQVRTVVEMIPGLQRGTWRSWDTAPGSFLEVASGMLRFKRTSAHLPDAAGDRLLHAKHRDWRIQRAQERALYHSPMAMLTDKDVERVAADVAGDPLHKRPLVEGKRITAWSRKSRARMQQQLRRLDFNPLFEDGLQPAMVTLTMPGTGNDGSRDYWQTLAPTPAAFKRMIERFRRSYAYAWDQPIRGVWKLEFQERGAPHVHILMTPPVGVAKGPYAYEFRRWLSAEWARCVGATGAARERHERVGTGVDYVADQYRDPRRIATYFGKHGFFTAKEYQNEVPAIWLDAIKDGARGARFWGNWGLKKASAVLQLDDTGSAGIVTVLDPLGLVKLTSAALSAEVGDEAAEAEERHAYSTDASVLRARQRAIDAIGSGAPDDVRVQRHLRKLSASLAHRGVAHVRNRHGQLVLPAEKIRRVKYTRVDRDTGELRTVRRYYVGWYHGGNGFVLVDDGRRSGLDIARLLGGGFKIVARYDLAA